MLTIKPEFEHALTEKKNNKQTNKQTQTMYFERLRRVHLI